MIVPGDHQMGLGVVLINATRYLRCGIRLRVWVRKLIKQIPPHSTTDSLSHQIGNVAPAH